MTSFPYFQLSRRHQSDYGLVLAYAAMQERLLTFDPPCLDEQTRTAANVLSDDCRHEIKAAVYMEHRRRRQNMETKCRKILDAEVEAAAWALVPFCYGAFEWQTMPDGSRVQPPCQPNDLARHAARTILEAAARVQN